MYDQVAFAYDAPAVIPPEDQTPEEEGTEGSRIAFMLLSTVGIFFVAHGIAFFYSGLSSRKSALNQSVLSCFALAVISIQWCVFGCSLAYSSFLPVIGDLRNVGLRQLIAAGDGVELANAFYAGMFCVSSGTIMSGAVAERGRALPTLMFLFVWATLVYDPVAYWIWSSSGWLHKLKVIDFAGGAVVHITAGFSALAFSQVLGPRFEFNRPSSSSVLVVIGTSLAWAGWFGITSGSAFAPTLRAALAFINTQASAAAGGLVWMALDYRIDKRLSVIGFCSGVITGLVVITPLAGLVEPWQAIIAGAVAGAACNFTTKLKFLLGIDDALDVFAVHGVGGILGTLAAGILARPSIRQLAIQTVACASVAVYSYGMSSIILLAMKRFVPLRADAEDEIVGLDYAEHDELAYDYVHGYMEPLDSDHEDNEEEVSNFSGL
ncbi:ammonium transporter Mep3p [Trichomonascus vanleenenianus]|uniref:ammonium transporter n=1 Tax=Trichomonascus vanleenenianus TaxID=2268995 RepID=UPI003EC95820